MGIFIGLYLGRQSPVPIRMRHANPSAVEISRHLKWPISRLFVLAQERTKARAGHGEVGDVQKGRLGPSLHTD